MNKEQLLDIAKAFFKAFDPESKVEVLDQNGPEGIGVNWWIKVESPNSGHLIGKNGETLQSIQYILRLMASEKSGEFLPITVDVAGYKEKRESELKELALAMAQNVKTSGYPQEMRPMGAYERRLVHVALQDFPGIKSDSIGEGELRRVKIEPSDEANKV